MMQDVHVKLNPGFPWQSTFLQEEGFFHQQIGLKNLRKKLVKLLHLEHSFVRCCNLECVERYLKCVENFEMWCWGLDGEHQLDRSCEK